MIAYIITAFICLTIINIANAKIICDCGLSWRYFIYKLSENNGRCIYLLLFSVFSYLLGFIFSFSTPVVGYIFILISIFLSILYIILFCSYLKEKIDGDIFVFIIEEIILAIFILICVMAGIGILCLMYIFSLFICCISAKLYQIYTSNKIMEQFKNTDFMTDKYRICIISSFEQDVASTFINIVGDKKICKIYDRMPPRNLSKEKDFKGDICVVTAEPEGVTSVSELISLVKPDVLIVLGVKDEPDKRILKAIYDKTIVFTNNGTLLKRENSVDISSFKEKEYGYVKEENMIIELCVRICLMIGIDKESIDNNIKSAL